MFDELKEVKYFNPLSANPTKWSNTLKQFCEIGAYRVKEITDFKSLIM